MHETLPQDCSFASSVAPQICVAIHAETCVFYARKEDMSMRPVYDRLADTCCSCGHLVRRHALKGDGACKNKNCDCQASITGVDMGDDCARCGQHMWGAKIFYCTDCRDEDPSIEAAERNPVLRSDEEWAAFFEGIPPEHRRSTPPPTGDLF